MHLGLVTYNLARDWDISAIIQRCTETGFEGVELRTTHAHGIEDTLTAEQRHAVHQRFSDSPITLVGLGTTFEYHSLDPQIVRQNIEGTKRYLQLAADVGALGVKVRPNGHQEQAGIPRAKTLEQIGHAVRECGVTARDLGLELRVEMHGSVAGASDMRQIFAVADGYGWACWNSNQIDVKDGSVQHDFDLVSRWIRLVHITRIWNPGYPYAELFHLLKGTGYQGFCLAEIPSSADPVELMHYYRALFDALGGR
ncbi:MAG: sugar phosphate isomerase/epimerase [Chloroflexi bacterium]|nr:sugar phosphate isomerase/epimerase [Chloroflexota bacterium]